MDIMMSVLAEKYLNGFELVNSVTHWGGVTWAGYQQKNAVEKITVEIYVNKRVPHLQYELIWKKNDKRHSDTGPAVIRLNDAGEVVYEAYMRNGFHHRDPKDGPAIISDDHRHHKETYYFENLKHRPITEGPAISSWSVDDKGNELHRHVEYYENNRKIRASEVKKLLNRPKP